MPVMVFTFFPAGNRSIMKSGLTRKLCRLDGYLTVYLSLLMAVLLSFFLALTEGARYSALMFESACVTDIGINSIMAEYHRELLDQYNIFAIDCSYLTDHAAKANTERHLKNYIDRNLSNESLFLTNLLYKDFLGMKTEDVELTGILLLSDKGGAVFRKSAVNAIKDDTGLAMLEALKEWVKEIEERGLDSWDPEAEKERIDEEIEEKICEIREYNDEKKAQEEYSSPTAFLDGIRREGILKQTVPDSSTLSDKQINAASLIESRTAQEKVSIGNVELYQGSALEEMEERFFFQEYLLKYMGYFGEEKENSALAYQLEYLIGGENSDVENLRITANRICMLREASNAAYLFSDEEKKGQAQILASVISFLIGAPEVEELLETSIILGWAYAESIYDVKMLLSGGRIPLVKDESTWHYSLSNALKLWHEDGESKEGLSYKDYLRTILMFIDNEKLTMRAMNMVEADIRQTENNSFFRLDACLTEMDVNVRIGSSFGYSFESQRRKKYE